jgi:acetyl-CoA acetyltransferase
MGVGPWAAIPLAIEKTGITKEAVDGWEINSVRQLVRVVRRGSSWGRGGV